MDIVCGTVRRTDIHQHLWPDGFLCALARRTVQPRLRRDGRTWLLELPGDPPATFDPADHDPSTRTGYDRIVVAPSLPLGIEDEALLDEFHRGILELGPPFELWASLPCDVDALLDAGAVGVAVAGRDLLRSGPALERLAARGAPLFVHPGPAAGSPPWFPALTAYVAEMSEAWHAWAAWGRARFPTLRVVFAMLAGLAPLHSERLAARGGPAEAVHDPLTAFDTSSYGPRAIDAMLRLVGVDRLLYGSDRPVIEPPRLDALGAAVSHALQVTNPERFL
jgi:hypothetical protein